MKAKSLKKSLICSVLSLVMCFSMLIGTTFAWFTDSVTNNVNQIVSGNLDVELYHTTDYTTDATAYEVVESDTALYDNLAWVHGADSNVATMWQPNVMTTEGFKIENKGSLPLKYKMNILFTNATETPAGKTLADVLVITAKDVNGEVDSFEGTTTLKNFVYSGVLNAGETYEFTTNIAWNQSANDNDYNVAGGLSIDLGVKLVATQLSDEADLPIATTKEAQEALDNAQDGDTLVLTPGSYGTLYLRQNASTTEILDPTGHPDYKRTLKNVTIMADGEGVLVDGIVLQVGHVHDDAYNYVTDKVVEAGQNAYYSYFDITNLTIKGLNLSKGIYIGADSNVVSNPLLNLDGLTIENCTMVGTDNTANVDGNRLLRIGNGDNMLKNVVVDNCTVTNTFQGAFVYGLVDLTISNSTFDNLGHNMINANGGNILVSGNTIKNCNLDRIFRLSGLKATDTITYENNTIINSTGDEEGELYKNSDSDANATIVFTGNTIDGMAWDPALNPVVHTVVNTTEKAQAALDSATEGDVIYFAAGTYDRLYFRQHASTTEVLNSNAHPDYKRTLKDVTLMPKGNGSVKVDGIKLNVGHVYDDAYNYVTDKVVSAGQNAYYSYFDVSNLTIKGFDLTSGIYIAADSNVVSNPLLNLDGLYVLNCTMTGTDNTANTTYNKLMQIGNGDNILKNIVVDGCTVTNAFQGVYAYGLVDITIQNSTFDNLGHNVLNASGGIGLVSGNTIKNCNSDRIFRLSGLEATDSYTYENNTILNSTGDEDGQLFKVSDSDANATIVFTGNTLDGNAWNPL